MFSLPGRASDAGPDAIEPEDGPVDFHDWMCEAEESLLESRRFNHDDPHVERREKRRMALQAIEQIQKALEVL